MGGGTSRLTHLLCAATVTSLLCFQGCAYDSTFISPSKCPVVIASDLSVMFPRVCVWSALLGQARQCWQRLWQQNVVQHSLMCPHQHSHQNIAESLRNSSDCFLKWYDIFA